MPIRSHRGTVREEGPRGNHSLLQGTEAPRGSRMVMLDCRIWHGLDLGTATRINPLHSKVLVRLAVELTIVTVVHYLLLMGCHDRQPPKEGLTDTHQFYLPHHAPLLFHITRETPSTSDVLAPLSHSEDLSLSYIPQAP